MSVTCQSHVSYMSSAFSRNCVDLDSLKKAVTRCNADKHLLVVCIDTKHAANMCRSVLDCNKNEVSSS